MFTEASLTLRNAPTIDAVPVVHGEWVPAIHSRIRAIPPKCSNCGASGITDFHYCPNCGAKMDGETEHGNTYSLGKIEMPKGAMKQIIADGERGERKDGEHEDKAYVH